MLLVETKLERDLPADLPPSRERLARYLTKVSPGQVGADVSKVRMVEEVVELKPELKIDPLRDVGVLVHRQVGLHELRITKLICLLVAIRARCGRRELSGREDASEKNAPGCSLAITGNVGKIVVISISVVVPAPTKRGPIENRERISTLVNTRPAESPPSSQLPDCSQTILQAG